MATSSWCYHWKKQTWCPFHSQNILLHGWKAGCRHLFMCTTPRQKIHVQLAHNRTSALSSYQHAMMLPQWCRIRIPTVIFMAIQMWIVLCYVVNIYESWELSEQDAGWLKLQLLNICIKLMYVWIFLNYILVFLPPRMPFKLSIGPLDWTTVKKVRSKY